MATCTWWRPYRPGQPVKHYTQWGELAPQSQQQLVQLEALIVAAREDSRVLDAIPRLREEQQRGAGAGMGAGAGVGGVSQRRDLERASTQASSALKLLVRSGSLCCLGIPGYPPIRPSYPHDELWHFRHLAYLNTSLPPSTLCFVRVADTPNSHQTPPRDDVAGAGHP